MNIKKKPRVIVVRTAGTNCDIETAYAFEIAGAKPERVHINRLIDGSRKLKDYSVMAIPGGFSYGDDIASGKILANEIRCTLMGELKKFIKSGRIVIGICNGFQVLVKAGLLPNLERDYESVHASLSLNDSAKFEDRWVYLRHNPGKRGRGKCVWTSNISDVIYLPVAHAEGKFIPGSERVLKDLIHNDQIVFTYRDASGCRGSFPVNPNGSIADIAGICDKSGRVLGLMPHPERHIQFTQHPFWTRLHKRDEGDGLQIFRNGVEFVSRL